MSTDARRYGDAWRSYEDRPKALAQTWSLADGACLSLIVFLVIAVPAYCGWHRIFWEDEMLGWMLLHDPSWKHMMFAWRHGADGGGLTFYILGRLWFAIFGSSVTCFRMFSAVSFAAGAAICWTTMRKFYRTGPATFATLGVWLVSPLLVQYMTFGRFYGLLMALTAATISLAILYSERDRLTWGNYLVWFCAHALLTTTHQLGILYSLLATGIALLLDRHRKRWRPMLYATAVMSWLLLLPQIPAMQATARVGKPYFWITQPGPFEFALMFTAFSPVIGLLLACILGVVLWKSLRQGKLKETIRDAFSRRAPIFITVAVLFLAPAILYVLGLVGPVLCVGRYLQPVALATTFLLAEGATLALSLPLVFVQRSGCIYAACGALFAALLVYDFAYRTRHTTLHLNYTDSLTQALPKGVPIVCEDAFSFTELMALQHNSEVLYTYLLDWPRTISTDVPRLEVTQYHLMENWKNVGYFSGSIQYAEFFKKETPVFYSISFQDVVDRKPYLKPLIVDRSSLIGSNLHQELAANANYSVARVREVALGELTASIWKICRRDASGCSTMPVTKASGT